MKKNALLAGAAVALAVVAYAAFRGTGDTGGAEAAAWPAAKVALAEAGRVQVPRAQAGVGALEAIRQVEISAETAGRVTRIAFTSGQRVKEGELLVQLNDGPEQAERLRLQAQLRNAETALARTRRLHAERVATQEQLDNAAAARDMALGDLQRIEAVIAQKAIRAPFAGVVGIRRVHEGQYLNPGAAIASLVDAGTLHVNFSLEEQASTRIQVGQPVELRVDAWPGRSFQAEISAIDPLVGTSRTVQVQARLGNPDGSLQAGMFAGVRVLPRQAEYALAVPETAVTYTAYGQTVFRVRDSGTGGPAAERVAVTTGERWDGRVEIVSGLREGDRVVVSGQHRLSDGMAVQPLPADTLAAPKTEGAAR